MNKKSIKLIILLFFTFLSAPFSLFADISISPEAEALFEDFMDFRRLLSLTETDEEALLKIEDFMNEKYKPVRNSFSEHEQVVMENFYITERYNYMKYDKNGGAAISEKELLNLLEKNKVYFEKYKNESFSGWTYITSANVIGCYMSFNPVSTALKYGLEQKNWFKKAYEQDKSFWYAASHYAQWLFFAPGFYGGGKKKALELFEEAMNIAKTDTEKYYSLIFLSQYYFSEGDKILSEKYLDMADTFLPGGRYIRFIREINAQGHSTFEYKE